MGSSRLSEGSRSLWPARGPMGTVSPAALPSPLHAYEGMDVTRPKCWPIDLSAGAACLPSVMGIYNLVFLYPLEERSFCLG